MPPQYKPWTYANRQMVRERQSKDFRTNTDVYVRDANRPDEDDSEPEAIGGPARTADVGRVVAGG